MSAAPARRRAALIALPALIAGLLAPLAYAAPASAAVLSNGITTIKTGFAIDGNKTVTNDTPDTFDWDDFLVVDDLTNVGSEGLFEFIPTGPYVTTDGNQSTGIIDATFAWDNGTLEEECSKPDDTGFPGSQKPDDNPWVSGYVPSVTGKANGCSFGSAHEIVTVGSVEHHILYQYWTRLVDVGDMTTYQTLEGGDAGRCDDYLVEFNYDPSDGTSVRVLEWVPTVSGDCAVGAEGAWSAVAPNFPYQAAVGTRFEGADLPAAGQTFGEVAVDLTAAGLFDEDSCTAFKTSGYVTRTGNKVDAELGDMVGGADPLTISNCGAITISKEALPSTATSAATFGYLVDRTTTGPAHEASLAGVSGATPLTDTTPGDNTQIGSALAIGAKHTWTGVFAGTYALSEDAIPGNVPWALASMECKVKNPTTGQVVTFNTLTNGVLGGIPVYTSATTDCVITNTTSYLVIEKVATGGSGTFGFDLNGVNGPLTPEVTINTSEGSKSVAIPYAPGTVVTVTELLLDGADPDWQLAAVSCGDIVGSTAQANVTVTTIAGQTTTCTFSNERNGQISITKTAVGGDGTFKFTLQERGADKAAIGAPQEVAVTTTGSPKTATFPNVTPGAHYSLAEVSPGAGWDVGLLTCSVTAASGGAAVPIADLSYFLVNPGDSIACAITNTARGTIIVVKDVTGADDTFSFTGSWLTPEGFTITTETGTKTATFENVAPGPYSLVEVLSADAGYDGVALKCFETGTGDTTVELSTLTASLKLQPGEKITCTYTNSEWGGLVVDKVTVPSGAEQLFDFEWKPVGGTAGKFALADQTTAFSTGPIAPGDYVVTEKGATGWSLTGIVCTDPAEDDTPPVIVGASATVHVGLGETVTCTFTNAKRGPLEFDKVVKSAPVNNGDGTWTIAYTLTVTSKSNIPENYNLKDELDFGDGIVPTTVGVISNNGVTVNAGWDGVGDIVVATGATVPALGTHTYTVTVTAEIDDEIDPAAADCTVDDGEGTGFLNAGSIEFWSGTDDDDACAVLPVSDLEITKGAPFSVDFEPADGPTEFDYTIVVENLGPATAEDVVLEDPLPANLDFVSVTASAGTCGFAAGVVTCELGDLVVGAKRTVTVTVSIPVDYPLGDEKVSITIENVASTSTTTPESDLTNNEDDADTTVLITLPLPPEDPELPTLALTGAAIGFATQFGLGLLAVGVALAVASLRRRRTGGRHAA